MPLFVLLCTLKPGLLRSRVFSCHGWQPFLSQRLSLAYVVCSYGEVIYFSPREDPAPQPSSGLILRNVGERLMDWSCSPSLLPNALNGGTNEFTS